MYVSRRGLFTEVLGMAANHIPKIIPSSVKNLLGIDNKPLSPDEAAIHLQKVRRNRSLAPAVIRNHPVQNVHLGGELKQK